MITASYTIRAKRHAGWTDALLIEQQVGSTWTPVDLTSYTARMQVRTQPGDDTELLATLDSEATGITIDAENGLITLALPDTLTGLIPAGRWVYDLRLVPPGVDAEYLIGGPFIMEDSVTTP